MKWPWDWFPARRRVMYRSPRVVPVVVNHHEELEQARRARVEAERSVADARRKRTAVHEVAEALRGQRKSNQFAERMAASFKSRSRPP